MCSPSLSSLFSVISNLNGGSVLSFYILCLLFPFHCCQERSFHSNSTSQSLMLDSEVNINLILEMIKGLVTKLADAKLSDLNYNLGRLKEEVVTESGEYLDNFKTDFSLVSSLVKAETGKINEKVFNGRLQLPTISTARLNIFEGKKLYITMT